MNGTIQATGLRQGVVVDLSPGYVTVRIQQQSACQACHARAYCVSSECTERELHLETGGHTFALGEIVMISAEERVGRLAVLLAFVLPLLLLVGSLAFLLHDGEHHRSINVARASAHHEAFEGSESHGGVDALAVVYCRNGSAVADVAGDDLLIFGLHAKEVAHAVGDEAVARAVRTPATDVHLLVVVVGHGIHVGVCRHGLVEGGVKHKDVGHVFHHSFHCIVALEGRRVVKGSKVHEGLPLLEHVGGDEAAFGETTTCYDAVTGSGDFVDALDGTMLGMGEGVEHHLDALGVGGAVEVELEFLTVVIGGFEESSFLTHALDAASCEHSASVHFIELIFDRTASAVDDENLHCSRTLDVRN